MVSIFPCTENGTNLNKKSQFWDNFTPELDLTWISCQAGLPLPFAEKFKLIQMEEYFTGHPSIVPMRMTQAVLLHSRYFYVYGWQDSLSDPKMAGDLCLVRVPAAEVRCLHDKPHSHYSFHKTQNLAQTRFHPSTASNKRGIDYLQHCYSCLSLLEKRYQRREPLQRKRSREALVENLNRNSI